MGTLGYWRRQVLVAAGGQGSRTSWVPVAGSAAQRPDAVLTSSVAIRPSGASFHLSVAALEQEAAASSESFEPAAVPFSARHQPLTLTVPLACGCQCCQLEVEQVASTASVPEVPTHLPGEPEVSGAAERSQCSFAWLVELAQGSITGWAPLPALANGSSRHLPDCWLRSCASVDACQTWEPSSELHGSSATLVPLAVPLPTTCRHLPPILSVPSWTIVKRWFALPVQVERLMRVPLAEVLDESLRHLPLPPIWRIWPARPAAAAALTVQVNVDVPVPPRASAAETVTLNVPYRVGQPVVTPAELIDVPVGRPDALSVGLAPAFWSGPEVVTLNQTGVPTVDERAVLA